MKPDHGKIDQLNSEEALDFLAKNIFAHLACHLNDDIYLVPITYAFKDGYLYSHSRPGKKIQMMRQNPSVCIQVDEVKDFNRWKSVLVWGDFEELNGDSATLGMRTLIQKVLAKYPEGRRSDLEIDFSAQLESAVIFRIKIKKVTGRAEGALSNEIFL